MDGCESYLVLRCVIVTRAVTVLKHGTVYLMYHVTFGQKSVQHLNKRDVLNKVRNGYHGY